MKSIEEIAIEALRKIEILDYEGLELFPNESPLELAQNHSEEYHRLCLAILFAKQALALINQAQQDMN